MFIWRTNGCPRVHNIWTKCAEKYCSPTIKWTPKIRLWSCHRMRSNTDCMACNWHGWCRASILTKCLFNHWFFSWMRVVVDWKVQPTNCRCRCWFQLRKAACIYTLVSKYSTVITRPLKLAITRKECHPHLQIAPSCGLIHNPLCRLYIHPLAILHCHG